MSDISLTLFNSIFDNKTDKYMDLSSFQEFESLLYKLSRVYRKSKRDSQLISPASYKADTNRRANVNVSHWAAWAAMDVDNHDFSAENLQNEVTEAYGKHQFVCYSTASSTKEHPKFRVVFPLTSTVDADNIRHFWFALNQEIGGIADAQTKDLSRMYYIPGNYDSAYNFIFSNHDGIIMNPSDLMNKHEYIPPKSNNSFLDRLPEAMQREIIQHRKESLERKGSANWSSYRDCPYVNQNLIKEYKAIAHVDNTGRYAMIYKIMVSIASLAVKSGYAITENEIVNIIRELDMETAQRYQDRPLQTEASRALEFAYRNM